MDHIEDVDPIQAKGVAYLVNGDRLITCFEANTVVVISSDRVRAFVEALLADAPPKTTVRLQ